MNCSSTVGSCSANPVVGVAVNCTITPTVAAGGAPIASVTVNWGDGTGDQNLGAIQSGGTVVSHVYASSNTYTVTATATDTNGQRGTGSAALNVNRSLPTVTITCPGTQVVGASGTVTVNIPTNPPIPIQNVTVDFGDGTSRNLGQITGTTSFTKAYGAEGGYTVTATVTDSVGQRGSSSCGVLVNRANAPTITFSQTSSTTPPANPAGPPEQFTVNATAGSGLTIRSIVVTRANGDVLYNQSGGGTFAALVAAGDVLTATATDSADNRSTSQIVVQ